MNLRLKGKRAVITGGSRGIGAAIALAFSREGADVFILHHRDSEQAQRTLAQLRQSASVCGELSCDIADERQVELAVNTLIETMGGIDILVNGAGIGGGGDIETMALSLWNRVMAVNLTGAFLMAKSCYPYMKQQRWGRIINISSQMAFKGGAEATAYCASKAGMLGFTRSLAGEAAPYGVLVNAIAPGATVTDLLKACGEQGMAAIKQTIPLGRFAEVEEIAPTAVMLASEEGSFYVGQTLSPNGGDIFH